MNKNNPNISIAILAAGIGQRLKWPLGKPLVPFLGRPLIDHIITQCTQMAQECDGGLLGVIVGHQKENLLNYLDKLSCLKEIPYHHAIQESLLGTADALKSYYKQIPKAKDSTYTLVCCADTPLITKKEMMALFNKMQQNSNLDMLIGTFKTSNPYGLGRIIRLENSNHNIDIVEEKDATEEQRKIQEVNSGLYIFKTSFLLKALEQIGPSAITKEYYLPLACKYTQNADVHLFDEPELFLGINTPSERLALEKIYQQKMIQSFLDQGTILYDPTQIYIHGKLKMGRGCIIYPNVIFQGDVELGDFVTIHANSIIKDSIIKNNVSILSHSNIEGAQISQKAQIGPFARIRPESIIGENVKIGNFVETKKVNLNSGVKISHLSYVGDSKIGENTNIGCGFISCNYDGKNKHKTIIGKNCFIGSDTQMIAPITIGNECFVASGSTINKDMPDESFAIARAKQETKIGLAKKFIKK